jgi:hypothetical protein
MAVYAATDSTSEYGKSAQRRIGRKRAQQAGPVVGFALSGRCAMIAAPIFHPVPP